MKIKSGVSLSYFGSLDSQLSFTVSMTPLLIPSLESVSSTSSFSSFFSPSFRSSGWMTQVLSLYSSKSPSDGYSNTEVLAPIYLDGIVTSLRSDLSCLVQE